MRILPAALWLFASAIPLCGLPSQAYAENLQEVLAKRGVPLESLSTTERSQPITSYAESKGNAPFLLAYYDDDGSGTLKSPLHVLRYRAGDGLYRVDLIGTDAPFSASTRELNSVCLGSALAIQQVGDIVYIETHITPSAGCVLILSSYLQFKAALPGWVLGAMGQFLIVEGNEVHFADTHPATVAVYDWKSDALTAVYPPKEDPRRKRFSAALASHLPTEEWCRQENKTCEPTRFSSDISVVNIDEAEQSFSFTAIMSPEGFGNKAEREIGTESVSYDFRLRGRKWEYTER